jgi:hypothetical protein
MGHGGTALVNRTYAHMRTVRHWATVLEYRVEQRVTMLGVRLGAVRGQGITTVFDTGSDTPPIDRVS